MKATYSIFTLLFCLLMGTGFAQNLVELPEEKINWMTWEEMATANAKEPKKIFVDAYTDWCGWCKRMDATTFKDPELVKYVNEHYYAVKFNAEMKDTIVFQDSVMTSSKPEGRSAHQLAIWLLNGRLSYPTFVILDENYNNFGPIPGYKKPTELEPFLRFVGEGLHQTTDWSTFLSTFQPQFN